jgi:ATP-dependent helicase/nuclease subunit B
MSDHSTEFGAGAYSTLVSVVRELKAGDPLRSVTVLVPTEHVGVAARRALARGDGRPGIAAVQILTLRRLAESLAAPELVAQGRRPLTTTTLANAVRMVLREAPGAFERVARQIGTVRALAEAHRTLRPLDDLSPLTGAVPAETVRVHRALQRHVAQTTYDEVDLLRGAAGGTEGPVVAFLLHDLDPPEQTLLAALPDLHRIDGRDIAPLADRVRHASDPDDEVRAAVREIMEALREGTPGHRIAVLYGSADPYARLLHERLATAGVTFFGRGIRPTLETPLGRGLLRMLRLPEHGFRRDEVLAWITDAPVRFRGERVPSSRWERVSRAAGVVKDEQWERLDEFADQGHYQADDARHLLEFVRELRGGFAALDAATSWAEVANAAQALWDTTLAADGDTLTPDADRTARRITTALDALSHLTGEADLAALRELLELQLADDLDRVGQIGVGVHVGSVADGYGADVDRLIVLGAAEGILPSRPTDDPLLPDRVRELTAGVLPTTSDRVARQRRDLHAALAAAPPGGRTVSFPRGDLRGGGSRVPSRWLLPTLRSLGTPDVTITTWERADGLHEIPSYAGAVVSEPPATRQEWRQRAAVAGVDTDELTSALGRLRARRRAPWFTEFTGDLSGTILPDPTTGTPISASALEQWATCPWGYFVGQMLRARPVEQPEDVVRVSPLVKGNIVHAALEGLVTQARAEGWAPTAHEPWPEQSWPALDSHARSAFEEYERQGLTGRPLLWAEDSAALLEDLRVWLVRDNERRGLHGGLVALEEEWEFGREGQPSVELELGDGRRLRLLGTIDRIDADEQGRLVVTDYKTGKRRTSREEQRWDGGRRLQLPLYALAAAQYFDHPAGEPVRAAYWYTSRSAGFVEEPMVLDGEAQESATATVRAIVDGMTRGVFPSRPTRDGAYYQGRPTSYVTCAACDPDGLGEQIHPSWEQLVTDRRLLTHRSVHELLFPEVHA